MDPQSPNNIGKDFLYMYTNTHDEVFQFVDSVNLVCRKTKIEKHISVITNSRIYFDCKQICSIFFFRKRFGVNGA